MSDVGKLVDIIAREALAEPLKSAGYRKDGRTWRRRAGESVLVVNVQASRWNDRSEGQFTLNVGVYFPTLAEQLAIYPVADRPAECECHLRQRPVMLSTSGLDAWWKVSPADSVDKISATAAEVRVIFQNHAQPWLDRLKNLSAAKDELVLKKNWWWASAACLVLGNHEEAKNLLKTAIQEGQRQEIRERLQHWGEDRGLLEEKR